MMPVDSFIRLNGSRLFTAMAVDQEDQSVEQPPLRIIRARVARGRSDGSPGDPPRVEEQETG